MQLNAFRGAASPLQKPALPACSVCAEVRSDANGIADRDVAARRHLGIDTAVGVSEALHQRARNGEVANAGIRINVGGRATLNTLDHFYSRAFTDDEFAPKQIELMPGRPARHI